MISSWLIKPLPETKCSFHHPPHPGYLSITVKPTNTFSMNQTGFIFLAGVCSTLIRHVQSVPVDIENVIVCCLFHAPPLNCGVSTNKCRADNLRLATKKTIDLHRIKLGPFKTGMLFFFCFVCFNTFFFFSPCLKSLRSLLSARSFKMM